MKEIYKIRDDIINTIKKEQAENDEQTEDDETETDDEIGLDWIYGSKDKLEKLKKVLMKLNHLILAKIISL